MSAWRYARELIEPDLALLFHDDAGRRSGGLSLRTSGKGIEEPVDD